MTKIEKIEELRDWCDRESSNCDKCIFKEEADTDESWCCHDGNWGKDAPEELFDDALKRIKAIENTPCADTIGTIKEDVVNHPKHYTNGGMECIDEMIMIFGKQTVMHFCLCNAWKYRYRAVYKNGDEDMKKSHWYMAKYKELRDGNYQ